MLQKNDGRVAYPDLGPMWELYLDYLKELLPWEQKTVIRPIDRSLLEADRTEEL